MKLLRRILKIVFILVGVLGAIFVGLVIHELLHPSTTPETIVEPSPKPTPIIPIQPSYHAYTYYYDHLPPEEQTVYTEILDTLQAANTETQLSTMDPNLVQKIYDCVLLDHPELFYVKAYTLTEYSMNDTVTHYTLKSENAIDEEEITTRAAAIDAKTKELLQTISVDMTPYEKIKKIYETIILNTDYVPSEDDQNICSVFLNQQSICMGYAKATQYLYNLVGIPNILAVGNTTKDGIEESHAWNLVQIDSMWYIVDTTWGDPMHMNPDEAQYMAPISYSYLLCNDRDVTKTHQSTSPAILPACTSTTYNYYVQENAYFNAVDYEQLKRLIDQAYASSNPYITFKCADEEVYSEMNRQLFENQGIFNLLPIYGEATIHYSQNEDTHTYAVTLPQ